MVENSHLVHLWKVVQRAS